MYNKAKIKRFRKVIAINWMRVTVSTTREGIEPLCERFALLSDNGFEVVDSSEFFAFASGKKNNWDYIYNLQQIFLLLSY